MFGGFKFLVQHHDADEANDMMDRGPQLSQEESGLPDRQEASLIIEGYNQTPRESSNTSPT